MNNTAQDEDQHALQTVRNSDNEEEDVFVDDKMMSNVGFLPQIQHHNKLNSFNHVTDQH